MQLIPDTLERDFFRVLNSYVEPAVRKGLLSSRFTPSSLIVLETTGFKTGATRRTPLLANRLGPYLLVSTVRGEKSFWVKNLKKKSDTLYFLGGKPRNAEAFVIGHGLSDDDTSNLQGFIGHLANALRPLTNRGWAFVLLRADKTCSTAATAQ